MANNRSKLAIAATLVAAAAFGYFVVSRFLPQSTPLLLYPPDRSIAIVAPVNQVVVSEFEEDEDDVVLGRPTEEEEIAETTPVPAAPIVPPSAQVAANAPKTPAPRPVQSQPQRSAIRTTPVAAARPASSNRRPSDCDQRIYFCWQFFGSAPYARSREEAMKNRSEVFENAFGFSPACVAAALQVTESPGTIAYLNVGDVLPVMVSTNGEAHKNTKLDFAPVRPGITYAATAEAWTIFCDGEEKQVLLPEICFNWSYRNPPRGQEACVSIEFDVKAGDEVRWALLTRRPMPRSGCWEVCDGSECTSPQTPCDVCDWTVALASVPGDRKPIHSGKYTAHAMHQKVSMPLAARAEYPAFCDERPGLGISDGWAVSPSLWRGSTYHIPDGVPGASWPVWGPRALELQRQRGVRVM